MKAPTVIVFSLIFPTSALAFITFPGSQTARNELKTKILDLATETKRGITATPEKQQEMLELFEKLEKLNPTKAPLTSPKVNGDWSLDYSTSESIIGKGGFPRVGPIVQNINTNDLSAQNSEVVSYFGLKVPRKITAELSPENKQFTNVLFKKFTIGPISFDAPDSFRGGLDITYVDDDVRLTRGDKGNIFVLTRM
jgi:hypothetical protein